MTAKTPASKRARSRHGGDINEEEEVKQPPPPLSALAQALRDLQIKYPFEDSELANAGLTDGAMRELWAVKELTHVEVDQLLDFSDRRASSKQMASLFVEEALNVRQYGAESLKRGGFRVPIAVCHGSPGSGKTTLLHQMRHWFTTMGGTGGPSNKALFATFGGDGTNTQDFDASAAPELRIAHRLLHAAVNPAMDVKTVIEELNTKIAGAGVGCFSDPAVLIPALRGALAMGEDDHLLIAFDEVRKITTATGPIHEVSRAAVGVLMYIGSLSQVSFIHRRGGGVVLAVGSALAACDPKAACAHSLRPIHAIPLSSVDPTPYVELACQLLQIAAHSPRGAKVRAVLWQARFNARCLKDTFRNLTDPRTPYDIKGHIESIEARMRASLDGFIRAVGNRPVPGLLNALFWPKWICSAACLDAGVEMDEVLLAEAHGICAILTGSRRTAVYMHPAMCAMLCRHLIDAKGYTEPPPTEAAKASAIAQRQSAKEALCSANATLRILVSSVSAGWRRPGESDCFAIG